MTIKEEVNSWIAFRMHLIGQEFKAPVEFFVDFALLTIYANGIVKKSFLERLLKDRTTHFALRVRRSLKYDGYTVEYPEGLCLTELGEHKARELYKKIKQTYDLLGYEI